MPTSAEIMKSLKVRKSNFRFLDGKFLIAVISSTVDWGDIMDLTKLIDQHDPDRKWMDHWTAMGDDVANAVGFNLQSLKKVREILSLHEELREEYGDKILEGILKDWPGRNEYS